MTLQGGWGYSLLPERYFNLVLLSCSITCCFSFFFLLNFANISAQNLGRYFFFSKATDIPCTIPSFLKRMAGRINVASQQHKKCWSSKGHWDSKLGPQEQMV